MSSIDVVMWVDDRGGYVDYSPSAHRRRAAVFVYFKLGVRNILVVADNGGALELFHSFRVECHRNTEWGFPEIGESQKPTGAGTMASGDIQRWNDPRLGVTTSPEHYGTVRGLLERYDRKFLAGLAKAAADAAVAAAEDDESKIA